MNTNNQNQTSGTDATGATPTSFTVGKVNVSAQKAKVEAQFTALVNGVETLLTDVTTFLFRNQQVPKTQVVTVFSARIAAAEKTKAARIALHQAVMDEKAAAAAAKPLVSDVKGFVTNRYGKDSPTLQQFGFTPAKAPQKSAASKASGVAKAKATKQALGPTGKKQRRTAAKALNAQAAGNAPAATPAGTNGSNVTK